MSDSAEAIQYQEVCTVWLCVISIARRSVLGFPISSMTTLRFLSPFFYWLVGNECNAVQGTHARGRRECSCGTGATRKFSAHTNDQRIGASPCCRCGCVANYHKQVHDDHHFRAGCHNTAAGGLVDCIVRARPQAFASMEGPFSTYFSFLFFFTNDFPNTIVTVHHANKKGR